MKEIEPELFIDGQFRATKGVDPVIEAATERPLGNAPDPTVGDIDDAVDASRKALYDWQATPAPERAQLLEQLADAIETGAGLTAADRELTVRPTILSLMGL